MYKILLTGLGSIGKRHLRLLQEHDLPMEIHAYRSSGVDKNEFPDVIQHTNLEAALTEDPDVAFVTNPTSLHVETATACAKAGCHLFIEKPLSHSLDGLDELINTVERNDLITYVACSLRFHPVLQRISSLLDNNTVGNIYSYRAYSGSYLPDWRPNQDYRTSYSADPKMGGGAVLDLIHEIDYTYWLFGNIVDVRSWVGQVSDLGIESEDIAEIILETASGAVGQIHLDYYRPDPRRTIEICGSSGTIRGDLIDGTIHIRTAQHSKKEQLEFTSNDMYERQLRSFL